MDLPNLHYSVREEFRGVDLEKLDFFSSEVLGVSMGGFAGDPLSIILRGVRKAVEIPTASSAIIFMSLL